MPLTTPQVQELSRATADDLKNWRRRNIEGVPPGERGRVADWTRAEALQICFLKALVGSGFSLREAQRTSSELCHFEAEFGRRGKEFPRYWGFNLLTGQKLPMGAEHTVEQVALSLPDDQGTGALCGDGEALGVPSDFRPGARVVILDLGDICRRVDAAFAEIAE